MAARDRYEAQVRLLVSVLPYLAEERVFALKGGTAINLFVRDLPRLSVDIDLAYLPVQDRKTSLANIEAALKRFAKAVVASNPRVRVFERVHAEGHIEKIDIVAAGAQVKVEVQPIVRGTVYEAVSMTVRPNVEAVFGFAETQVVSLPDLYAGKIVAALDRQHPRDLFDVQLLLANEGITAELREAFIAYLLASKKPLNTVLAPTLKELSKVYEQEFVGMSTTEVSLESLLVTRDELIARMLGEMSQEHRRFLLSFKEGAPDWSLVGVPTIKDLPAVKYRQQNLAGLAERQPEVFRAQLERLKSVLAGEGRGDGGRV